MPADAVRAPLAHTQGAAGPSRILQVTAPRLVRAFGEVVDPSVLQKCARLWRLEGAKGCKLVAPASQALPTDGKPRGVWEADSGLRAPSTAAPSPNRECEGLAHTVPPPPELRWGEGGDSNPQAELQGLFHPQGTV